MGRSRSAVLLAVLLLPSAAGAGAVARVVAGGVLGLATGTAATLAVVVARASFQEHYLESTREIMSWQGAPIPLGAAAGGTAGAAGGAILGGVALGIVAGGAVGAGAGAALGAVFSGPGPDTWAGGIIGAAVGMVAGFILGWVAARRRRRSRGGRSAGPAGVGAALLAALLLPACGGDEPVERAAAMAVPADPGPAEDVVVLVGDPGKARYRYYPVIPRVAAEVEAWAREIGRDSAVAVVVLGDIVYPDGMHEPGDPGYRTDSARVADQVDMVREPAALEHSARMYFVAGNHDWGLHEDRAGARRLRNLGAFLDRVRARGANVDLLPPAGSGVPHVVDIGDRLRLILLDTAWWLFDAEPEGKEAFVDGLAEAMAGAGDRQVVIAAHHPYASAGPHGGLAPVWEAMGVRYLLHRSGSILQDVSSRPYRDMRRAMGEVFARVGRPLVFAGGHEHSLQVIAHGAATAPRYSLVSGSASKLTGVGPLEGTVFQASVPGYIQLVVREDGAVDVEVVGAPAEYLSCPENEPADLEWERCMAEGEEAFETLFAARLAAPTD